MDKLTIPESRGGADEKAFFNSAKEVFAEVDSVNGTLPGEDGRGLGPGFNANICAMCHAFPAVGGTNLVFRIPDRSKAFRKARL